MGLMPVYYNSWSSKKSKKQKFKSAEAKREYEENINSEFGLAKKRKKVYNTSISNPMLNPKPYIRETKYIPSLGNGIGNAVKPSEKVYTGTKMIGIGTLHKSNAVPVFSDSDAKDMASMRR